MDQVDFLIRTLIAFVVAESHMPDIYKADTVWLQRCIY